MCGGNHIDSYIHLYIHLLLGNAASLGYDNCAVLLGTTNSRGRSSHIYPHDKKGGIAYNVSRAAVGSRYLLVE